MKTLFKNLFNNKYLTIFSYSDIYLPLIDFYFSHLKNYPVSFLPKTENNGKSVYKRRYTGIEHNNIYLEIVLFRKKYTLIVNYNFKNIGPEEAKIRHKLQIKKAQEKLRPLE